MDKTEIIKNITRYQEGIYFHPLTCRNASSHDLLEPILLDGQVVLKCPTCNSLQHEDEIPDMFLDESLKTLMDAQDEYYKMIFQEKSK